jgi:hypothetical protein
MCVKKVNLLHGTAAEEDQGNDESEEDDEEPATHAGICSFLVYIHFPDRGPCTVIG